MASQTHTPDSSTCLANQVLLQPYLLRMVMRELRGILDAEEKDEKKTRSYTSKALTALLPTCKTFADAALDHIWDRLDSVYPLLRTFPGFGQRDGTYVHS